MKLEVKSASALSRKRIPIITLAGLPIPTSVVGIIAAWGGKGKTMLSIKMAYDYLALYPHKKAMLWLTEDPEGEIWRRTEAIKRAQRAVGDPYMLDPDIVTMPPIKITARTQKGISASKEFKQLRSQLDRYDMIVLDPLLNFNGGRENDNEDARALMEPLSQLAREGGKVVILLHHSSKSLDGEVTVRGASDFINASRFVYNVDASTATNTQRIALIKSNMGLDKLWSPIKEYREHNFVPDDMFWPVDEKRDIPDTVTISYSTELADGYFPVTVPFRKIRGLMASEFNYSATSFVNEYRTSSNALPGQDVVILDFDEGMTLDEAKMKFSAFKAVIGTTRNHQVSKNGVICDRFRVAIQCSPMSLNVEEYKQMMITVTDIFGSDPACKDMARMYYGNPNADVYETDGTELFDWEEYWMRTQVRIARESRMYTAYCEENKIDESTTPDERRDIRRGYAQRVLVPSNRDNALFAIASICRNDGLSDEEILSEVKGWMEWVHEKYPYADKFNNADLKRICRRYTKN